MTVEYYYLLMSQQDLLQNEVIEEVIRERTNSYALLNKKTDFWILISPKFASFPEINEKIQQTNFYKQKRNDLISSTNSEFYSAVVSVNKEFIIWLSLRLGYFENIETFMELNPVNRNYVSNGVFGKIEQNDKNLQFSPLKSNPNYLFPDLLASKYKKLIELTYSLMD